MALSLKAALGRIRVYDDLDRFMTRQMNENGIVGWPVEILHALGVYGLPDLHRGPFDRASGIGPIAIRGPAGTDVLGGRLKTSDPIVTPSTRRRMR